MGNVCCQSVEPTYDLSFLQYCTEHSSQQYKAYFSIISEDQLPQEDSQAKKHKNDQQHNHKVYKLGNWGKEGPETGVGIIFSPSRFYYEGTIQNGNAQGQGLIIHVNRSSYRGDVTQNKANGKGQFTSQDSDSKELLLSGQWSNGLPKINSEFSLQVDGKHHQIIFLETHSAASQHRENAEQPSERSLRRSYLILKVKIIFENKMTYVGEVKQHTKQYVISGKGLMTFCDKSTYKGEFQNAKFHGKGKYSWPNGHQFQGEYKFGRKDGQGKYFDGQKIIMGMWIDGTYNRSKIQPQ